MKPTQADSSRFTCRLDRRWQAVTGGDPARSGHVAGCADCRAYYQNCAAWETALKREANRNRSMAPQGLDQRIFTAVRASGERPSASSFRTEKIALASFGALAAAIALGFYLRSPVSFPNQGTPEAENQTDVAALISATQAASKELWQKFEPSAIELTRTNPLQNEIDSVYADAQSAVGFLALNFLPSTTQKNAPRPPPTDSPQRG